MTMRHTLIALVLLAAVGCSSKPTVVVYSPNGPEMLKELETRFETAHPDVDLQPFDMGSQDVFNRIRAESGAPQADLWWGGPSSMFMQAADMGLLQPYTPAWADAIPMEYKDQSGLWSGMFRSPLAILFNHRHYKKEDVPQTWDELLEPKWRGKIVLRKPLPSGTMRTFIGAMILRAENEDAGIEWLKRLHAATKTYMENPQLLFDHIKRNPDTITVWLMADVVLQRELNGYPFDYHVPMQTPVITEGIAIVKGAPHPDWAKQVYEFLNTPEMLALQAKKFAKVPVRTDLAPNTLPEWMVKQSIDPMVIDAKAFALQEQGWMDRWEREVAPAR